VGCVAQEENRPRAALRVGEGETGRPPIKLNVRGFKWITKGGTKKKSLSGGKKQGRLAKGRGAKASCWTVKEPNDGLRKIVT